MERKAKKRNVENVNRKLCRRSVQKDTLASISNLINEIKWIMY